MFSQNILLMTIDSFIVDEPAHPRCLDSIISPVSISKISTPWLFSSAAQAGLRHTWSQTPKTGFLVTWLS